MTDDASTVRDYLLAILDAEVARSGNVHSVSYRLAMQALDLEAAAYTNRWAAFTDNELLALQLWNESLSDPGLLPDAVRHADGELAIQLTEELERREIAEDPPPQMNR